MDIVISNSSGRPIYEQIVLQIKDLIADGRLEPGQALPSMRLLAKELRVSVITTKRAYEELERDGFVETVAGKGCFISGRDLTLVREHRLRQVEEQLQRAVDMARDAGIGQDEMRQLLELIYEE